MKIRHFLLAGICLATAAGEESVYRDYFKDNPGCVFRFAWPENAGVRQVDALCFVRGADGRYRTRNLRRTFLFRDGTMENSFTPAAAGNYWSEILKADSLLEVESADRGKTLRAGIEIPEWARYRLRRAGIYLLPVSGGRISDGNYTIPPAPGRELIREFQLLEPEQEPDWLRRQLEGAAHSAMRLSLLERLEEIGEFRYPLTSRQRIWCFKEFRRKQDNAFRRKLFELVTENNFLASDPLVVDALKDEALAELAGNVFQNKSAGEFEVLMRRWSTDDELWKYAGFQSARMTNHSGFRKAILARRQGAPLTQYDIPLLCTEGPGNSEIKDLLAKEQNLAQFQLFRAAAEWIGRTYPQSYTAEIHEFLRRTAGNDYLARSVVYPLMYYALCKAGEYKDAAGYFSTVTDPALQDRILALYRRDLPGNLSYPELLDYLKAKEKR